MSTVFGTVEVVVAIYLEVTFVAAAVVVSKRVFSLGDSALVVRPFFFGIEGALIATRFLVWDSSVLASDISSSSYLSDRSQKVLFC